MTRTGRPQPRRRRPPETGHGGTTAPSASAREKWNARRARKGSETVASLAQVVNHLAANHFAAIPSGSGAADQAALACLEGRLQGRSVILSDRKIPGARGVIDHVVVAASGVWVVDSRPANSGFELRQGNYRAPWGTGSMSDGELGRTSDHGPFPRRPESDDDRAFLGLLDQLGELDSCPVVDEAAGDDCLLVDGHDRTWAVGRVSSKADAVRTVLRGGSGYDRATVIPALSFVGDWEPPTEFRMLAGVWVAWPEALAGLIETPGHLDGGDVEAAAALLDTAFPPAVGETSGPAVPRV